MRNRLLIVALIVFNFISATRVFGQGAVTAFSVDTLFQGQVYPDMSVYGNNAFPPGYAVYEIRLCRTIGNVNQSIMYQDNFYWPSHAWADSSHTYNELNRFFPFDIDTGLADIVITRITDTGSFITDTLHNAIRIIYPDAFAGGYVFLDLDRNTLFDNGDSITTNFLPYVDSYRTNVRYDSLKHFYFPVRNGNHIIAHPSMDDYVLTTTPFYFPVNMNGNSFDGAEFGFTRGFYSCSPDTVHQNDTVTLDLYSYGLFPVDAITLFDSTYTGVWNSDSLELTLDGIVIIFDSNHVQVTFTVPSNFIGKCPMLVRSFGTYSLENGLYILPPIINNSSEISSAVLTVFPNPANRVIHLSRTFTPDTEIQVYNVFGQFYKVNLIAPDIIDISNLPAGMYDLRIDNDLTSCRLSFIKLSTQ